MKAFLDIEREIGRLPGKDLMELAARMLPRAEEKGLIAACMEAEAESSERAGRDGRTMKMAAGSRRGE